MDFLTTLHRSGGIVAIARHLDVEPARVSAAAERLLSILLAGFGQLQRSEGIEPLLRELSALGGASLAAEILGVEPADRARGLAVISRLPPEPFLQIAGESGQADRLDSELAEQMLPLLAMLTAGYISATALRDEAGVAEVAALLATSGSSGSSA